MTTISATDSLADADAITAILVAYNRQFTPGMPRLPLRLVVRDDGGAVVEDMPKGFAQVWLAKRFT